MDIRKELQGKTIAIFDYETDGFLHALTTVHCGTLIDALTKDTFESTDKQKQELLDKLEEYDVLVGHNIIGYDLPMLKKMYDWEPRSEVLILDTLWLSRMYYPDIEGGHSLGVWGERLKNAKEEYYPVMDEGQPVYNPDEKFPSKNPCWTGSIYTAKMQGYCTQDCNVNVDLFWWLLKALEAFSWNSIICEMETAILIQRQMEHGFVFDYKAAEILHAKLDGRRMELEDIVQQTFKPIAKFIKEVQPKVRMNGTVSPVGLKSIMELMGDDIFPVPDFTRAEHTEDKWIPCDKEHAGAFHDGDAGYVYARPTTIKTVTYQSGAFSSIHWPEFSLGSRAQIAERLTLAGYKLKNFTEKGNPIIDDSTLQVAADAGIPEAKPLAEYFMITKRVGMVKGWIKSAVWNEAQGVYRIHGYVNSLGAATTRMTHSNPNVAQVPGGHSPYGEECRSLFTVRTGYKLVGCDASGLELRCLANYMNDATYIDTLLNGDIHWANAIAAGFVAMGTIRDKTSAAHDAIRDMCKTFIYGFLYGGGDKKIGSIVGGGAKQGKELKDRFLNNTPALKRLREGILAAVAKRKWLKGFDGRIIRIRSPHSALNTLLQGMGAIVMKYWLIEVARVADLEGLEWYPSANIHDEAQCEVADKDVKRFKEICEASFPVISKQLGSKCLLEGEAMEGENWYQTH